MTKIPFLGKSSAKTQSPPPLQLLNFQASPIKKDTTLLSRVGPYGETFPLFAYTGSKKSIQLTRVGAGSSHIQPTPIGDAKFHTWSDADFNFMGQSLSFKERDAIGGYKLDHPQYGKLKFYDNEDKEGYILKDSQGVRIARYRPGANKSIVGGVIEVYVSIDDHFLDLVVLFTIAMIHESDDFGDDVKETAANFKKTEHIVDALGGGGQ